MALKSPPISSCDLHRPRTAIMFVGEVCPLCEVIEDLVRAGAVLPTTEEGLRQVESVLLDRLHPEDEEE